jgi:hypothetical protein
MYGKVLLAGAAGGCAVEAMQLVALVSAENVFHNPRWAGGKRWDHSRTNCSTTLRGCWHVYGFRRVLHVVLACVPGCLACTAVYINAC